MHDGCAVAVQYRTADLGRSPAAASALLPPKPEVLLAVAFSYSTVTSTLISEARYSV